MVPSRAARHLPAEFVAVDDPDWATGTFHPGPHPAGSVVCAYDHHVRPHGLPDPSPVAVAGFAAGVPRVHRGALEGDLVVCGTAHDAAAIVRLTDSGPAGADPAGLVWVDAGVLSAVAVGTWETFVACMACAGVDALGRLAGLGWWALHGRFDAAGVQGAAADGLGCGGGLWVLRAGVEVAVHS